jgi:hypothetical protein
LEVEFFKDVPFNVISLSWLASTYLTSLCYV